MEKSSYFLDFLPRSVFLTSLVIGFVGSLSGTLLQATGTCREYALFSLPLMGVPFLVVQFYAKGNFTERLGKILIGSFIAFILAMVPGGAIGMYLGDQFQ
ncbi:MAG: hypothetical protein ABIT37_02430 [Luteolibacter sp.]